MFVKNIFIWGILEIAWFCVWKTNQSGPLQKNIDEYHNDEYGLQVSTIIKVIYNIYGLTCPKTFIWRIFDKYLHYFV
jgi:hypothetical protein